MEMKRVLRVIVIRSGVLLTLLVVLIMAIKTLVQHGPPVDPTRTKLLAVLKGNDIKENLLQIKGIRDGIAYNGLKYTLEEFRSDQLFDPNNKIVPNIIYCLDPCLTEDILKYRKKEDTQILIGYSFIEKPHQNFININAALNWKEILPIYKKVLPNFEKLGIIYSKGSCDGALQASIIKDALTSESQISLIIHTLNVHGNGIKEAILSLANEVDVIYAVSRDRIIQNNFDTILQICLEEKIPLIGAGIIGPQEGAVASITHNPYKVGRKCSDIIRELEKDSDTLRIGTVDIEPDLYLNITSAYSLGLIIPSDIRKKARQVYD